MNTAWRKQAGDDLKASSLRTVFIIPEGAIEAAKRENLSTVLPSCDAYKPQQRQACQEMLDGAIITYILAVDNGYLIGLIGRHSYRVLKPSQISIASETVKLEEHLLPVY